MNVYFETSALVKLFLDEPEADFARDLWDQSDLVSIGRIAYPEARAALAAAQRTGRITPSELDDASGSLNRLWVQVQVIELDEALAASAGELAESHALRGFDAIHLATMLALRDESLVIATWDDDLRTASLNSGLRVAMTSSAD
ncbi:MAG: type II toxin-antitoxin system VapC family toxin [Actinomycetota bacterium]|nr:type II toxin-antitoxin system VapC family toxin [Actinomycetota bacterium]